MCQLHWCYQY